MTSITFDPCFVFRTKSIIEEYDGDKEFTLLINCLLGLIIFIHEKAIRNELLGSTDFLKTKIKDIEQFTFLHDIEYIKDKNLSNFLEKFRNGIAHMNIKAVNTEKKRSEITIGGDCIKPIKLTYDQVKTIAVYITDKYLESFSKYDLKCI